MVFTSIIIFTKNLTILTKYGVSTIPLTPRIKKLQQFCRYCTKCAPKIGQLLFKLMLLENI